LFIVEFSAAKGNFRCRQLVYIVPSVADQLLHSGEERKLLLSLSASAEVWLRGVEVNWNC